MQWWTGEGCRNGIKNWWQGEYIPPPPDNPNSPFVVISAGSYRRHWTARTVRALGAFYLRHWKFLFTLALALGGLIGTYLNLK